MNTPQPPQRKKSHSILRSAGIMSLITLLSRILGLGREAAKAYYLGTGVAADAFNLAFSLPNLFRRLTAEGAMLNAFIPTFTDLTAKGDKRATQGFVACFFWCLAALTTLISVCFILLAPSLIRHVFAPGFDAPTSQLTSWLTQYMFVYLVFISLAAVLQGVLNAHKSFAIPALTPSFLNIAMVLGMVLGAHWLGIEAVWGLATGTLVGGVLQLILQYPFAYRLGFSLSPLSIARRAEFAAAWRPSLQVFKYMLPAIVGTGIYQINTIIGNRIATGLATGSLSALVFSNRLTELVLGVFVVSVSTVLLPTLSRSIVEKEEEKSLSIIAEGIGLVSFVSIPATLGIVITADDLVHMLFGYGAFDERSHSLTVAALLFQIPAVLFIGCNRIFITSLQASKYFSLTVKVAGVVMIINLVGAYTLAEYLQHSGIALAGTLSQIAQCAIFLAIMERYFPGILKALPYPSLGRHLLCGLIMAAVLLPIMRYTQHNISSVYGRYPLYAICGILIYGGGAWLLGVPELRQIQAIFRKNKAHKA